MFTEVCESIIERRMIVHAGTYVGHVAAVSAYLQLPEPVRQDALGVTLESLPTRVEVVADLQLEPARRR